MLGYADNTHLKGFQGNDVVQLGDYYVKANFGAVTNCDSPDFNGEGCLVNPHPNIRLYLVMFQVLMVLWALVCPLRTLQPRRQMLAEWAAWVAWAR